MAELSRALDDARRGAGRVVLISGEAGIGKTSLVEAFARGPGASARRWWGVCDDLFTPRPLGPLHDIAAQGARGETGRVAALLRDGADRVDHAAVFAAVLRELAARPTLAVFEDVHWADDATLDLLRYLGRRVAQTSALLVLTYRDDELGPGHPLRAVLGDLPSPAVRRVTLPPLSEPSVRALVGDRGLDAAALHRQTGGNPFFVTEVLAGAGGLPPTIRDAVAARVARVSPAAQAALAAAAVVGPRIEPDVLARVAGAAGDEAWPALEECLSSGVLVAQGEWLAFRHELARQAVLESLSPPRRQALHRATLAALRATPAGRADPARLAHHAQAAGDRAAVLAFAPVAAQEAAAASAHRVAATLYRLALDYADALPPAEHARLLERYAQECNLVDRRAEGVEVCRKALGIWRELGDPLRQGSLLWQLANMLIGVGRNDEAGDCAREAVALLEALGPGRELSAAYRMAANVRFLNHDFHDAIELADKALAVAETIGHVGEALSARNIVGSSRLFLDYEAGCRELEANLAAARDAGRIATAGHAYTNLGSSSCELYHLRRAERYLDEGITFAAEHDLDRYRFYMLGWRAMTHLRRGQWAEAADTAGRVLAQPDVSIPSRITALGALGLARARSGQPEADAALDEALELARPIGSLHRVGLARAARAEAAWLAGDPARAAAEAGAAFDLALDKRHPWFAGELAYWLGRAGATPFAPEQAAEWIAAPFRLSIAGDWAGAAAGWARLGCPYERARALTEGDTAAQLEALRLFEALGARPAADDLRRRLHAAGVARVPRGPRPATRDNPFGLTGRQAEILALLAEGLTNAQIAARLHLSPKTVDHHVSAVLAKLDVHSREAAAELARRSGL